MTIGWADASQRSPTRAHPRQADGLDADRGRPSHGATPGRARSDDRARQMHRHEPCGAVGLQRHREGEMGAGSGIVGHWAGAKLDAKS